MVNPTSNLSRPISQAGGSLASASSSILSSEDMLKTLPSSCELDTLCEYSHSIQATETDETTRFIKAIKAYKEQSLIPVAGSKTSRDRGSKDVKIKALDVPEIRLFTHINGDRFLASYPDAEGFYVDKFFDPMIQIIEALPDVAFFQKDQYLLALKQLKACQSSIDSIKIENNEMDSTIYQTFFEMHKECPIFKNPDQFFSETHPDSTYIYRFLQSAEKPHPSKTVVEDIRDLGDKFLHDYKDQLISDKEIEKTAHEFSLLFIKNIFKKLKDKQTTFCQTLADSISEMKVSESFYIPTGFMGAIFGHFCITRIQKTKAKTYNLSIYNQGDGILNHSYIRSDEKDRFRTSIDFIDIPEEILIQKDICGTFAILSTFVEFNHPVSYAYFESCKSGGMSERFYEQLYLLLREYFATDSTPDSKKFLVPQKSGTCTYRSTKALLVDFCDNYATYKKVIFKVKQNAFNQLLMKIASDISTISFSPTSSECILECLKKLSSYVQKHPITTEWTLKEKLTYLNQIQLCVDSLSTLKKSKLSLGENWLHHAIEPVKEIGLDKFHIINESKDSVSTKYSNHLIKHLSTLSFEDAIAYIVKNYHSDDVESSDIASEADEMMDPKLEEINLIVILKYIQSISLDNEDLIKEIKDKIKFLTNLSCLQKKTEEAAYFAPDMSIAINGKLFLIAHKICVSMHPSLLKDLPLGFKGYESNGFIEELNWSTDPLVVSIEEECFRYVDKFNASVREAPSKELDPKAFLFENILKGEIMYDSSLSKPRSDKVTPDYLLYNRLYERSGFDKIFPIDKKEKQKIYAIKDFYCFPYVACERDELKWLELLKRFAVSFYLNDSTPNLDKDNVVGKISHAKRSIIYQISEPAKSKIIEDIKEASSDFEKSLIEFLEGNTDSDSWMEGQKEYQDQVIKFLFHVKNSPSSKWLALINLMTSKETLLAQFELAHVLKYLFLVPKKDDHATQLLQFIQNEEFQAVFLKNLVDVLYNIVQFDVDIIQENIDDSHDKLKNELMDFYINILGKIFPHINQRNVNHEKLLKVFEYAATWDDDGGLYFDKIELIDSIIEKLDVSHDHDPARFARFGFGYCHERIFYEEDENKDRIRHVFFEFLKTNLAFLKANNAINQSLFDSISDAYKVERTQIESIDFDIETYDAKFTTSSSEIIVLDFNLNLYLVKGDTVSSIVKSSQADTFFKFLDFIKEPFNFDLDGKMVSSFGVYDCESQKLSLSESLEKAIGEPFKAKTWSMMKRSKDKGNFTKIDEMFLQRSAKSHKFRYDQDGSCYHVLISHDGTNNLAIIFHDSNIPAYLIISNDKGYKIWDYTSKKFKVLPQSLFLKKHFKESIMEVFTINASTEHVQVEITPENRPSFILNIQAKLGDKGPVSLEASPSYKLTSHARINELIPHALCFKHDTDQSLPLHVIFSCADLSSSLVFFAKYQNGSFECADLSTKLYLAYCYFRQEDLLEAHKLLNPILKQTKESINLNRHDATFLRLLIESLYKDYVQFTKNASFYRFFLLSLIHLAEAKTHEKTEELLQHYFSDVKKHFKEQIPFEILKSIAIKHKCYDKFSSFLQISSKQVVKKYYVYSPVSISLPKSYEELECLIDEDMSFMIESSDHLFEVSSSLKRTPLNFYEVLKWIKEEKFSKTTLLKFFAGNKQANTWLLKALILESSIVKSLPLDALTPKSKERILNAIFKNLSKLEVFLPKSFSNLHKDVMKIEKAIPIRINPKAHIGQTPFGSWETLEAAPDGAINRYLASIPKVEMPLSTQLLGNICTYSSYLRIFIKSQLSKADETDKAGRLVYLINLLKLNVDTISSRLEKQIIDTFQNSIITETKGTYPKYKLEIIKRPFISKFKEISFDDVVDAFENGTLNLYKMMIDSFDSLMPCSPEVIKACDNQIAFCLYLKILSSSLSKANQALKHGLRTDSDLDELLKKFTSQDLLENMPRTQLVFEYKFGHQLSRKQKEILEFLTSEQNHKLAQMVMGGGKSSVITPLLSNLYSKGPTSCLLLTPSSQLQTTIQYLDKSLRSTFNQNIEVLDFRKSTLSHDRLKTIHEKIINSNRVKTLFISTPESLQFLELELLKLVFQNQQDSSFQEVATLIIYLLSHFKNQTKVIVDEFACVSDVTKHTNIALASAVKPNFKLPQSYVVACELLFKSLYTDLSSRKITIQEALGDWKTTLKNIASLITSHENLSPQFADVKGDVLAYLQDEKITELKSDNTDQLEPLNLVKYMLHYVIPYSLQKTCGRHYGRSIQKESLGKVVPYQGVGTPSTTEFGHYFESISYHYLTAVQQPLSHDEVCKILDYLKQSAKNHAETYKIEIKDTFEAQQCKRLFSIELKEEYSRESVGNATAYAKQLFDQKKYAELLEIESYLVKIYVQPQNSYLSSNPHNLFSQFKSVTGFTGTPWNKDSYSIKFDGFCYFDPEVESSIENLFKAKETASKRSIFFPPSKKPAELMAFFKMNAISDFSKVSSIIDTGGVFSGLSNKQVAIQIADFLISRNIFLNKVQVLYFDRSDGQLTPDTPFLLTATRNIIQTSFESIPLPGLTEKNLLDAGVDLQTFFAYFDERHSFGTDIPLREDAIGIITVDKKLCHHSFLQGLMRLRKFSQKQNALVAAYSNDYKDIKTNADLLHKLKSNEKLQLAPVVFKSYKQQIHNIVRDFLMNYLIHSFIDDKTKSFNLSLAQTVFATLKEFFIQDETILPSKLLSEALEFISPAEALEQQAKELVGLLSKKGFMTEKLSEYIETKIKQILDKSKTYFPNSIPQSIISFDDEIHIERENEQELEQQLELEQEVLVEVQTIQDRDPIDDMTSELELPIEKILAHFDTKTSLFKDEKFEIASIKDFADKLKKDDPALELQKAFSNLILTSNHLAAHSGRCLDVFRSERKQIASVLAILNKTPSDISSSSFRFVHIGLTQEETAKAYEYLKSHTDTSAVLVNLDQEVLTRSTVEQFFKTELRKNINVFLEVYTYNQQPSLLLDHIEDFYKWVNDKDLGAKRLKFLKIQNSLNESELQEVLIKRCQDPDSEVISQLRDKAQTESKRQLLEELKTTSPKTSDLSIRIGNFIKSLPVWKLSELETELISYVPLHLTRHITGQNKIKKFTINQLKIATYAQRTLAESEDSTQDLAILSTISPSDIAASTSSSSSITPKGDAGLLNHEDEIAISSCSGGADSKSSPSLIPAPIDHWSLFFEAGSSSGTASTNSSSLNPLGGAGAPSPFGASLSGGAASSNSSSSSITPKGDASLLNHEDEIAISSCSGGADSKSSPSLIPAPIDPWSSFFEAGSSSGAATANSSSLNPLGGAGAESSSSSLSALPGSDILKISGDGHCLFRAFGTHLFAQVASATPEEKQTLLDSLTSLETTYNTWTSSMGINPLPALSDSITYLKNLINVRADTGIVDDLLVKHLRVVACASIIANEDLRIMIVPNSGGSDWDIAFFLKYIEDMSTTTKWGGQEELIALSHAFGVRSIQYDNRTGIFHENEKQFKASPFCVTVLFNGVNHYDTIKFEKP